MSESAERKTNEVYKIALGAPLLRGGLTISTEVSGQYVVKTMGKMMEMVRRHNDNENAKAAEKK